MIRGSPKFEADRQLEHKKALYIFVIPSYGLIISSFLEESLCGSVAQQLSGGWGNFQFGIAVWGS